MQQRRTKPLFDVPGMRITLPVIYRADHVIDNYDYLGHPNIVISEQCRELFKGSKMPLEVAKRMGSYSLLRPTTLPQLERTLDNNRQIEPWMFVSLLRTEGGDPEGFLEDGGHLNLFWIPQPIAAYRETTDGKLHVDVFDDKRIDQFTRVFFSGFPAE